MKIYRSPRKNYCPRQLLWLIPYKSIELKNKQKKVFCVLQCVSRILQTGSIDSKLCKLMIILHPVCSSVSTLTEIYMRVYIYARVCLYIHAHAQSFIGHVFSMQLRRITYISNARNTCHIIMPILCVNFKEIVSNWTGTILRQRPFHFWVTESNPLQWQIPRNCYLVIHLKQNSSFSLIPSDQVMTIASSSREPENGTGIETN